MGTQRMQTNRSTVLVTRRLIVIAAAVSLTTGLAAGAVGDGSMLVLDGTELTASGSGSNAVFATDSATALVRGVTIATEANNSRALDATYSGTILAGEVTASTSGDHSATVATDRGGGTVSIVDSELATAGSGSPLLYSTGDVQANGVTGTASGSQIAGMEGYNTILIRDSTLTGTNTGRTGSGSLSDAPITVNVGGTSTWVVTGDTTVSALNVASGGKMVDASGRMVTIVTGDETAVSGTSDLTVTVTGSYSTSVEAGDDTQLATDTVDRIAYDDRFGTATAWSL